MPDSTTTLDARAFPPRAARAAAARAAAWAPALAALLLTGFYVAKYLADPAAPAAGSGPHPGWLGWWDQSATLRSAAALAQGWLAPSEHHYPLGYALLGLPGYLAAPRDAFFAIDLLALLGSLAGFTRVARRLGVPAWAGAALFCACMVSDQTMFRQFVIPWNTIPVACLLWLLLGAAADWLAGARRPWLAGSLAAGVAVCRPSDAAIALIPLAAMAWSDLSRVRAAGSGRPPWGAWARLAAASAAVAAPVAALHVAIYGWAASPYMASSARIGFTLHDLGWKASVLWMNPEPWFFDGHGLLRARPWYALGLAGALLGLVRDPARRMLSAVLLAHGVMYVAYVDLLPTGLWRFSNVHYFSFAIPGYALLAVLLVRDLARPGWPRGAALASAALVLAAVSARFDPKPVRADEPAKAVDFLGPPPPFTETLLLNSFALEDDRGRLVNLADVRVLVALDGVRVVALRRDFAGQVRWVPGHAPAGYEGAEPARRMGVALRLSWPPRWLKRSIGPRIPIPES